MMLQVFWFLGSLVVLQVLVEQKEISGEEIDFILNSYPPQTPVSCLLEEENPGSLPFGRQEHGLKLEDALLTPSKGFLWICLEDTTIWILTQHGVWTTSGTFSLESGCIPWPRIWGVHSSNWYRPIHCSVKENLVKKKSQM